MRIADLILIDLFEDISKDELIKRLQKKRESQFLDMILEKMHELVKVMGDRQSIGGSAFDVSRMLGGAISGKELERLYKEKYTNESQISDQSKIFEDNNIIDNQKGWGAVPNNQEVDYLGLRVKMSPKTFINLAAPLDREPSEDIIKHIKNGGQIGSPFLIIEIPESWENGDLSMPARVAGHEGRNRMLAIAKTQGNAPIEVHLFFSQGLRNRHITDEFKKTLNKGLIKEKSKSIVKGPLFSLTESVLEWGRVVKGVNTTADVGPAEIKKQAAKFGNTVDKDGRPPTLSKKVKGSKTNVLHNLGLSEMEIACIEGGHSLDDLKPLKEKKKTPSKIFETLIGLTEDIAPHGSPEQEAQLMIDGKKPAALTQEQDFFKHFQTPAEMYDWVVLKFDLPNSVYTKYVVAQPGEANRAKQIASLVTAANKINFEFQNKNQEIEYHKTLGNLLGYKDSDIEDFIKKLQKKEKTDIPEQILLSEALKDYTTFAQSKFQEPNPKNKVDGVILGSKHYKDRETEKLVISEKQEVVRMFKKFVKDPVSRKVTNVDAEEGVSFCLFNDNNLGVALKKREFKFDQTDDLFVGYLVTTVSQNLLPYSDQLLFRVPNDPNEPCRLFNEQDKETLSRSQTKALGKQGRFGK